MIKKIIFSILIFFAFISNLFSQPFKQAHTEVSLIPEYESIQPGQSFWVGLKMKMDEGWHVYWKNPGDSGLPTRIDWKLPEGFKANPIVWPYPERIDLPPLTTYGYEEEIILLTKIETAPSISLAENISIEATVNWLACEIECIPGKAVLALPISVRSETPQKNKVFHQIYEAEKNRFPIRETTWQITATETAESVEFYLQPSQEIFLSGVQFFADQPDLMQHASEQKLQKKGSGYILEVLKTINFKGKVLDRIQGVLVADQPWRGENSSRGWELDIPVNRSRVDSPSKGNQLPADLNSLHLAILFAFLGGLILNLMPCVLPVLSIKVLNLIGHASDKKKILKEGAIFAFGILFSFWVLAGLLLVLRSFGAQVGWGFQFQSPWFLILMAALFLWLGLSMLGIFEIGTSLTTIENKFQNTKLLKNSFFNGILATIVATPCTAPFMGSAMGFALVNPPVYSFVIFTFLGAGMAFPYLVLCRFPQLLKFLPKPGSWMIRLKQFFGLLFLLTVVWLLWVFKIQRGSEAVRAVASGLAFIGFGGWVLGKWGNILKDSKTRFLTRMVVLIFVAAGLGLASRGASFVKAPPEDFLAGQPKGIPWQNFSPEYLEELLSQNKAVFIDFTAAWCLSCQVNEQLVFHSQKVIEKFKELDIVSLKADWTNYNETITKALAGYGKASVPLYVLYYGSSDEPIFLPELITPQIVLDYLKEIENEKR